MSVTRTIEIDDLTPDELAKLFTEMGSDDQARFFGTVWKIAQDWPGAGWCMQCLGIVEHADAEAMSALRTLSNHVVEAVA